VRKTAAQRKAQSGYNKLHSVKSYLRWIAGDNQGAEICQQLVIDNFGGSSEVSMVEGWDYAAKWSGVYRAIRPQFMGEI
jgi:hypothetical protein